MSIHGSGDCPLLSDGRANKCMSHRCSGRLAGGDAMWIEGEAGVNWGSMRRAGSLRKAEGGNSIYPKGYCLVTGEQSFSRMVALLR